MSCLLKYPWNSCLINHNLSNLFWEILLFASIIYISDGLILLQYQRQHRPKGQQRHRKQLQVKSWFKRVLEVWIGLRHDVYMYVWVFRFQKQVYDFIFLEHRFNSSLIPKEINYWSLYLIVFFSFFTSILYTPKCIYNYIYLILIFLACYLANVFYIVTFTVFSSPTPKETTTKETTTKPNPEITTPSGRITTTEPCNVPTGNG